jgi:hypothetical protein
MRELLLAAVALLSGCSPSSTDEPLAGSGYGKTGKHVAVQSYGAIPNDGIDDTSAIASAASALVAHDILEFQPGHYLVSSACATPVGVFGKSVAVISGLGDVTIRGDRTTIDVVDHDIAAHGGLTFLRASAVKGLTVEGIHFDMSYTGCNDTSALYPYCGAIVVEDAPASGDKTQWNLSSDIVIRDCSFRLYHPLGQYVTTSAPFNGDANNGYKLFGIFLHGDYLAGSYEHQNRNATITNCTWLDGHNGYGAWVWAYNNVRFTGLSAESWTGKRSFANGSVAGTGVGLVRYHQFGCSGVEVSGCDFRAKPSHERVSGFEGAAVFAYVGTNLSGDYSHGMNLIYGNRVLLSNGDAANGLTDYGVEVSAYGSTIVASNAFDGSPITGNDYGAVGIYGAYEPTGGNGNASLSITGNVWGSHCSYQNSISIANGSNVSAYHRRCKSLVVANNISNSQSQYFLDMTANSGCSHLGVANAVVSGNIVSGTLSTQWGSSSSNSRALHLASTEASDVLEVVGNQVSDKHTFAIAWYVNPLCHSRVRNNRLSGVTTEFVGGSLTNYQDP